MALDLLLTLFLVAANGFFVATEFAIARLRPTQVEEMERDGKPGARSARHAVEHIDAYLAACQLGITLASIGLGVVGKPFFEELLEPVLGGAASIAGFGVAAAIAFGIVTLLHVVLGELTPKSLAIARTETTSLGVAPPMRVFYLATKPVVDLFNAMGNLVLKPFGIPPAREAGHSPHSENELREILRQSLAEGLIDPGDREIAERGFEFGDRRVREIMRPRPEVEFVKLDTSPDDAARLAIETGYTRLPICEQEGGLDAAVGVVHVKDLLQADVERREVKLGDIARHLHRTSESTLIDELLRELRRGREHMALVLDEHGTAVGIATMEDILEELVGHIEDEFDPAQTELIERDGGKVVVEGSAPLHLVEEELGIALSDSHEATIGGHLLEQLGRLPDEGELIELDDYKVEVAGVDDARITRLRFLPVAPGADDEP